MKPLDLIFLGTPDIAAPSLRAVSRDHRVRLVVTQPDRPAGRGRKLRRGAVAAEADKLGLPVLQPDKAALAREEMAALQPDALVVVAFGQILPESVLSLGRLGAVNLHTSLLPLLRGPSPINSAILAGYEQTGVTTMFMDRGMDTGDIILQEATPIGPQETAGELFDRLAESGAELLVRTLDLIARGQAPRRPQDDAQATYAPMLKKNDGLLDWTRPALELDRQVRGLDPWPGAWTLWQGRPLKLFAPTRVLEMDHGRPPGEVLAAEANQEMLLVACGQGALGLGGLQAPGKKRQPAADFLRGARLSAGGLLGS